MKETQPGRLQNVCDKGWGYYWKIYDLPTLIVTRYKLAALLYSQKLKLQTFFVTREEAEC